MQQKPTQQGFDSLPFWRKIEIMEWLARFPALTLMVILRRDIGYRMLNPLWLVGVALVMVALASFTDEAHRPDHLLIFALVVLTLGFYQRYNRWREIRQGARHHTYYIGTSCFEWRSLPAFCQRDRRVARYADPIFCAIIGVVLFPYSRALAMWLVFSAFCLRAFEYAVYRNEVRRKLDTLDGMVDSEIQGENVEHFSPPPDGHSEDSPGIPTGIGADIHERIKNRKPKAGSPRP